MDEEIRKALTEKLTVSVEIAGKAFSLSRNAAYDACKSGQIPTYASGGRSPFQRRRFAGCSVSRTRPLPDGEAPPRLCV